MELFSQQEFNFFLMEDTLWLLTKQINVPNYDFLFEQFFTCRHPWNRYSRIKAVVRIGAIQDYSDFYNTLQAEGIELIHTPEEQLKCTELPNWYPLLEDITPKSVWFSHRPTVNEISQHFQWPIFMKGARQTSKHRKDLSIIDNPDAFVHALDAYAQDSILNWQQIICREFVKLRPVHSSSTDKIPSSFEFRTFWWKGKFVGAGRYWYEAESYTWNISEKREALALAQEAARRLAIPFLVIDVAQKLDKEWIIIECNDGQESGYAGIAPVSLWRNIISIEHGLHENS